MADSSVPNANDDDDWETMSGNDDESQEMFDAQEMLSHDGASTVTALTARSDGGGELDGEGSAGGTALGAAIAMAEVTEGGENAAAIEALAQQLGNSSSISGSGSLVSQEQESEYEEDEEEDSSDEESEIARMDKLKEQFPLGCEHYRRKCKIVAPCCDTPFWCRHCHNEIKNDPLAFVQAAKRPSAAAAMAPADRPHEIDRFAIKEVICAGCTKRQPVAQKCVDCGLVFGEYFCGICNFYDDDLKKNTYHCEQCGICRVGGKDKFFHCVTCGCCYAITLKDKHRCIEGSMLQNCPVCQENLFHSTKPSRLLKCGHMLHQSCLKDLMRTRYTCPVCNESVTDMANYFQQLDRDVLEFQMPPEYANQMVGILCNDCHKECQCKFHVVGHKCAHCGSYNTVRT